MSAARFTLRLPAATAAAGSHPSVKQGVARPLRLQQQPRLARQCRATGGGTGEGGDAGGSPDAGADFLKQYKSLAADIMAGAKPISSSSSSSDASEGSSSGCCDGSGGAKEESSGSGCCGGSSSASEGAAGAGDQAAATAVMQQLSSLMGGMEGSLTREDMRSAFEAGPQASGSDGERFIDVAAVLRGGPKGDEDDADELDALMV